MNDNVKIYDVFHDECKEDGFWHCFLFIPHSKKDELFSHLMQTRNNLDYFYPIHYCDIGKSYKKHYPKARLVKSWVSILLYAIQQQKFIKYKPKIYLGHKNGRPQYKIINPSDDIKARLTVFRERDNHEKMYNLPEIRKIEITFKMALKGAINFLFNQQVVIDKIYLDFSQEIIDESINKNKILDKLKNESANNINFSDKFSLYGHSKSDYGQGKPLSEFMQFVDVIIGAMRTQVIGLQEFKARMEITKAIKESLLKKDVSNFARMKESRYYQGFTLSEAWLERGEWQFDPLKIREKENNLKIPI